MQSTQPLSPELVERLFSRLSTIYGAQKMSAMWSGEAVDHGEVKATWGAALGRYPLKAIGRAVQALVDQAGEWPPTLPQFCELCRQFNRPEHEAAALPAPGAGHTSAEQARRNLARIREMLAGAIKPMPVE